MRKHQGEQFQSVKIIRPTVDVTENEAIIHNISEAESKFR